YMCVRRGRDFLANAVVLRHEYILLGDVVFVVRFGGLCFSLVRFVVDRAFGEHVALNRFIQVGFVADLVVDHCIVFQVVSGLDVVLLLA
ncbi:hypothetical protein AAHH78_34710, partial [Burkholderia pseudomallei]